MKEYKSGLVCAWVLPSLESDLGMALRQGLDSDSNPESRGAFCPLFIVFYSRRGKAFPSKEGFLSIVEFLPFIGYLYLCFIYL
jgi:hypothetical protein